jgi:hypothetical protein
MTAMNRRWLQAYFLVEALFWGAMFGVRHLHGPEWLFYVLLLAASVMSLVRIAKEYGWVK